MSKEFYEAPTAEIIELDAADVICTSGLSGLNIGGESTNHIKGSKWADIN